MISSMNLWVEGFFVNIFVPLMAIYLLFGIDDLFIDSVYWLKNLGPRKLAPKDLDIILEKREKRIAIMVAAWKEDDVLSEMVTGNIVHLLYGNYDFFLGVYPNDRKTLDVAQRISHQFKNVHIVVNTKPGPTSKGQMLNELVQGIFDYETKTNAYFDTFLIQDAEDILHPYSLKLINDEQDRADFVQIPIFSLPLPTKYLVGGTYIDEFAELHTKDILVRRFFGLSLPSAGVGTALSRHLVQKVRAHENGNLLNPKSVTEDYELGVSLFRYNLRSTFAFAYMVTANGERDYIATREYFPKNFMRSVRQKSRWTLGIAFQGFMNLGWKGSFLNRYFLYRDRKGPWSNILVLIGMATSSYLLARWALQMDLTRTIFDYYATLGITASHLGAMASFNILLMGNRLIQRMICTTRVYGGTTAAFVPPRFLLANIINSLASMKALQQFTASIISGRAPQWAKTTHELPANFLIKPIQVGVPNASQDLGVIGKFDSTKTQANDSATGML